MNVLSRLNRIEQGTGRVEQSGVGMRLGLAPNTQNEETLAYANAQLDDYQGLARCRFAHRPPLCLTVRARFLGDVTAVNGTAGFGLWNAPFGGGRRLPVLPTAIWYFFGGRACHMPFAYGVAGKGWKAASIQAQSAWGLGLLPLAPLGLLLFRSQYLYGRLWPWLQRRLGIAEALLPKKLVGEWHDYTIEWVEKGAVFRIDNEIVLESAAKISGPLGLVIWVDNQYLVATPQGELKSGVTEYSAEPKLEIEEVTMCKMEK